MSTAKTAAVANTQRARKKAENSKKVFKTVLDNPFTVQWQAQRIISPHSIINNASCRPHVPPNVQNSILAATSEHLSGLRDYHIGREQASRRAKQARRRNTTKNASQDEPIATETPEGSASSSSNKRKRDAEDCTERPVKRPRLEAPILGKVTGSTKEMPIESEAPVLVRPTLLDDLNFGVNEVTKVLERLIKALRTPQPASSTATPPPLRLPLAILVCKPDINPPNLVAHIPHLVSICNSLLMTNGPSSIITANATNESETKAPDIKLVSLPNGAEETLANAIGLRRISILAIYVRLFLYSFHANILYANSF